MPCRLKYILSNFRFIFRIRRLPRRRMCSRLTPTCCSRGQTPLHRDCYATKWMDNSHLVPTRRETSSRTRLYIPFLISRRTSSRRSSVANLMAVVKAWLKGVYIIFDRTIILGLYVLDGFEVEIRNLWSPSSAYIFFIMLAITLKCYYEPSFFNTCDQLNVLLWTFFYLT